jgi:hypothetical protein
MTGDADPTLETDHLEQLLETPAPPQPVVVVQYRNRGVPTWVYFLSVMLVPPTALYVYHRTVVEKYNVRAAEDRSLLALQIKKERALLPLIRETPPSTAVLPEPKAAAGDGQDAGDASGSAIPGTAAASVVLHPAAKAPAPSNPPQSVASSVPSPTQPQGRASEPISPNPGPVVGQSGAVADQPGPAGAAENRNPFSQEKTTALTTRSDVLDPFATLESPPKPPIPNGGEGLAADAGMTGDPLSAEIRGPGGESGNVANRGRLLVIAPDKPKDGAADVASHVFPGEPRADGAAAGDQAAKPSGRIGPQPLAPLPTKEESEREINEAAAKLKAEKDSEVENRIFEIRGQRFEEQLKFRDELRELVKTKGNQAGPDIAKLKQRYDYEVDPVRWGQAYDWWRNSRAVSFRDKVKYVRSIDIPETAILELMCASLHNTIGTRQGPRDTNEVWVRAAEQLLRFELPRVPPVGARPSGGAGASAPPTRKTVVSSPR